MSLKEQINKMIEQYSITKDNPTVLRALMRLSELVGVVIDWIENNNPEDFTERIDEMNRRMDEIEALVNSLNLDTINAMIEDLKAQVQAASEKADRAAASANAASEKADSAMAKANENAQSISSLDTKITETDRRLTAGINSLETELANVSTKADDALTSASSAETKADSAVLTANNAKTAADNAKTAADNAKTAADNAMKRANEAYDGLASKQDKLTFDELPTARSDNPVTSGGVYEAIQNIPGASLRNDVTQTSQQGVTSAGIYNFVEKELDLPKKQIKSLQTEVAAHSSELGRIDRNLSDQGTKIMSLEQFDQTPTEGSQKAVTSDGIYKAIQNIPGGGGSVVLDDTVTETSVNGVKSSGIYAFGNGIKTELAQSIANVEATVTSHTDDIAALQTFQQTQESTNETHNTQIAANTQSINGLTTKTNAMETNITYMSTQVSKNTDSIAVLETEVDSAKDSITANKNEADNRISELTTELSGKQNRLKAGDVFIPESVLTSLTDTKPTDNSLATAAAVWQRIEDRRGGGEGPTVVFDDVVTQNSSNGVKSSGIYSFVQPVSEKADANETDIALLQADVAKKQDQLYSMSSGSKVDVTGVDSVISFQPIDGSTIPTTLAVYNFVKNKNSVMINTRWIGMQKGGTEDSIYYYVPENQDIIHGLYVSIENAGIYIPLIPYYQTSKIVCDDNGKQYFVNIYLRRITAGNLGFYERDLTARPLNSDGTLGDIVSMKLNPYVYLLVTSIA